MTVLEDKQVEFPAIVIATLWVIWIIRIVWALITRDIGGYDA